MKKIIFSLIALGLSAGAFAQTTLPSYKKRPSLGLNFFFKDVTTANLITQNSLGVVLSNKQWAKLGDMAPGVSLSYYNGITDKIDFVTTLGGSFTKFPFSTASGITPSTNNKFLLEATAGVNLKLLPDNYVVVPYAHIGIGASMYAGTYFAAYIPTGLGLQFNLGEETFLNAMFGYNNKVSATSINHFNYSIGVSSPLSDKKEPVIVTPPPPPAPVVVEADTDGDGIVDSKDKCPTVAGTAKYDGCPVPDTDGDGINDENDKCPTVKGLPEYNGCPVPDRDKDGINDVDDKCPDVPGVARYQGCPIPDRDKDGINDEEDKCPDVPGVRENQGCPMVKEEVVKKVNTSAKNIFFQTNSAKLLPKSFPALNAVVAILKEDAALKLDIEGHTDITGGDKINVPLSKNRAKSVYDYIVSQGIDASRLSSEGFASSQPIADNKTAAGRALNRRVVMKPKYY
ncbi:OmpA family protein [Sediminibacterium roseum]|uniref:OmpA family protein n=1 Tax=Sediminibacterium roseum TaxID=1978412 RepID=A0ABW9ZYB6_9BACT|nr:OmpA family protein [Sediminibacterium roseum]NCI50712.1 OmpA family protein [Sediminibacterium roseum]